MKIAADKETPSPEKANPFLFCLEKAKRSQLQYAAILERTKSDHFLSQDNPSPSLQVKRPTMRHSCKGSQPPAFRFFDALILVRQNKEISPEQ